MSNTIVCAVKSEEAGMGEREEREARPMGHRGQAEEPGCDGEGQGHVEREAWQERPRHGPVAYDWLIEKLPWIWH